MPGARAAAEPAPDAPGRCWRAIPRRFAARTARPALLLFAWASGGRRRSDRARHHREQRRAAGRFSLSAAPLKTNQAGAAAEDAKPIVGGGGQAWRMPAASRKARCSAGSGAGDAGRATGRRRRARYRAPALQLAGLDSYSAHSLRSGFITEAGRQQVLGDAMAMTATPAWPRPWATTAAGAAAAKAARLFDLAAADSRPPANADAGAARCATTWRAPARS